jgi:iron-sulfur cluster repair protein YtfE (RIC family)
MELLAELHEDHEVLDRVMARFERALEERHPSSARLAFVLGRLSALLTHHITVEEIHFYAPLRASRQAREDLIRVLTDEHEDLLRTLEHLDQLRPGRWSVRDEEFVTYSRHLIELYHEHADREHRLLFPLLEQPPPPPSPQPVEAPGLAIDRITPTTTLNAMVRRYPTLRQALRELHLDHPHFGGETLEEAAWHRGLEVEELLAELTRVLGLQRT